MKPNYLLPLVAAVLGFSIAWVAKPAASASVSSEKETKQKPATDIRPERSRQGRDASADKKKPAEVVAAEFPLADKADKGPKNHREAKMLRLTEALGLSIEQQGEVIRATEEALNIRSEPGSNTPVVLHMASVGKTLEEQLAKIFTPEQLAKFNEIRARERDNRIETRAQKMLIEAIEHIDISPDQRVALLTRLREKAKADMQSIPDSATLLLDKSILPTASDRNSIEGFLAVSRLQTEPTIEDPNQLFDAINNFQRQEIEDSLRPYDGVLTGGQMAQYHALMNERRNALDRAKRNQEEAVFKQQQLAKAGEQNKAPSPAPQQVSPPAPQFGSDEFEKDPEDE